ncbi:50S ribosomal protein L25 [uncultured Paludibacter sp.]|uniref:Large ribosomal subunit protein bL25 n=1 Tax=uncultured Paludibacter sp. TaxID=497635 RepID=A0A653ACC5_9BACT|nr:50S ribosomal protein L25 [uncultured Paludibacter sp.]
MKTFDLKGEARQELGKKATKAVRNEDAVPCVLYGGKENVHFTATESDLRKLIYSPDVFVVNLTVGKTATKAIMKDLQFHPVTDKVLHIDFLEVSDKKPVVVEIPVKLSGLAEGVKAGGKLSLEMRKLKVKGIYTNIPEIIEIDVTNLSLGKSIQVGKVQLKDLELLNAKNAVVAQVKLTRAARGAAATAGK